MLATFDQTSNANVHSWWCKREYYSRSKQGVQACQLDTFVFVVPAWATLRADASQIAIGGIYNVDIDTRWADYWATYSYKMREASLGDDFRLSLNDIKKNCAIFEPEEIYPGEGIGYFVDMLTPVTRKPTTYAPKFHTGSKIRSIPRPIWKVDKTFSISNHCGTKCHPTAAAQLWYYEDGPAYLGGLGCKRKWADEEYVPDERGAVTQPHYVEWA